MARRRRFLVWVIALGLTLPLAAAAVMSASRPSAPRQLLAGQRYVGDYFAVGDVIDLAGEVDGDVMVIASRVRIAGHVNGDVLALASDLAVSGDVSGDLRAAAVSLTVDGAVGKNVNIWAERWRISPTGSVGKNVWAAGDDLELAGSVGGNVTVRAHTVRLSGPVGGSAAVTLAGHGGLTLDPGARVSGDLTYWAPSRDQLHVTGTPAVDGAVVYREMPTPAWSERLRQEIFTRLFGFFGLVVVGLVLVSVLPRWCLELADLMVRRQPWLTAAWGLAGVVAVPMVAVLLAITVIGIPLSLMIAAVYLGAVYAAQAVAGITLGLVVTQRVGLGRFNRTMMVPMLLGLALFTVATSLGPAGWLMRAAAVLWGFGAILRSAAQALPRWR